MADVPLVAIIATATGGTLSTTIGGALVYLLKQVHDDARDVLEQVDANRERSEQNAEVLAKVLRNTDGSLDVDPTELVSDVESGSP